MEVFFPVYQGRVFPRGQYPLGWVLCTWEIPTSVGYFPVAIPTQVRVQETNNRNMYSLMVGGDEETSEEGIPLFKCSVFIS